MPKPSKIYQLATQEDLILRNILYVYSHFSKEYDEQKLREMVLGETKEEYESFRRYIHIKLEKGLLFIKIPSKK